MCSTAFGTKAVLTQARWHEVDSSESAFRAAGVRAVRMAISHANTQGSPSADQR
ncbi:hypothetical protein [Streptomyces sp. RKAG293]|uniref:hypothetical protein n=1 Tax=Streptomyces sp. RKAG293 TaxID=2893403 RepID=UPI0035A83D54